MNRFIANTKKLQTTLSPTDKHKLDEYLTSVREIERQLEKAQQDKTEINPGMEKPYGIPSDFAEHFKLMTDMVTVAFQADQTRVVTFIVTREGTSRSYREIGIPDGHHPLTHHRSDPALMEKVAQINTYHMQQFATWIARLKSIKEADSTLLDNSMIVYGAGLSDGNRHTHEDLPTLVAGRGGKFFKTGQRIVYRRETPLANLFLTMMDRMGIRVEHFGDATGQLDGLDLSQERLEKSGKSTILRMPISSKRGSECKLLDKKNHRSGSFSIPVLVTGLTRRWRSRCFTDSTAEARRGSFLS